MPKAFGGLGVTTGLAADRTSLTGMVAGQQFFETDTKLLWYFDGSVWQRVHPAGSVVQTVWTRYDTRTSYSSGGGSVANISQLALTITPRYASSRLLCQWMITGEAGFTEAYNGVFGVMRDGAVLTSPPYGYSSQWGNNRWSGIAPVAYDTDNNSTANCIFMQFMDDGYNSSALRVYSPFFRSSNSGSSVFMLNGTYGSTGDSYEASVSTGVCFEIMS